jgi:hypothetical protein
VNFVDATLLRLADPAAREAVFDQVALEQLITAAYDVEALQVEGPFTVVFDDLRFGVAVTPLATIEGTWNPLGGVDRTELRLQVTGLATEPTERVDALWRGAVVARATPATGRVSAVEPARPDPGRIDAEIIADLGALPADPAALEAERRSRLLVRLRAALAQPDVLTDQVFDGWLRGLGATSVSDLVTRVRGTAAPAAVQVAFAPADPAPPSPRPLPVAALLLIRDEGFSVAGLLAESNAVRSRLGQLGLDRPAEPGLPQREPVLVVWIVPETVFDDPGWPGANGGTPAAQRAARRAAAGAWLAQQGIGLATPSPP